jgi:hypothetical protein
VQTTETIDLTTEDEEVGGEAEAEVETQPVVDWEDYDAGDVSDTGSAVLTGGVDPDDIPQKELTDTMPSSPILHVDASDFPDVWAEDRTFTFT